VRRFAWPAVGLIGRIFAILLLTVVIEFGASTLLYERASQFSVREDEARRLAEHLVIARKLVSEGARDDRPAIAARLTTDRYAIGWSAIPEPLPRIAPALNEMRQQVVSWEPQLARTAIEVRLENPGRRPRVVGQLALADGSWMQFSTLHPLGGLDLSLERVLLALVPALALLALGAALVRQTLRPMRQLAAAADRFGTGQMREPVEEAGPNEIRRVVSAFNRMQGRIDRLIADRTEALAAVGHDLRTPLARLRLRADAIDTDDLRDEIATEIGEMDAMIASLLAYLGGDTDPEAPRRIDVAELCASLVDAANDMGHRASYRGPDHLEASVRASALRRAIGNLVDNATHYGTSLTVTLSTEAERLTITVEDNGPGIPAAALDRVMQPFVRLDTARARDTKGFGLGLAIVERAMQAEGGTLTLANRSVGGLVATLTLPRRD
jgi:signal transduction histidine kinase